MGLWLPFECDLDSAPATASTEPTTETTTTTETDPEPTETDPVLLSLQEPDDPLSETLEEKAERGRQIVARLFQLIGVDPPPAEAAPEPLPELPPH